LKNQNPPLRECEWYMQFILFYKGSNFDSLAFLNELIE